MGLLDRLFSHPFSIQFYLLTIIGFWYIETNNIWKKRAYSIYRFLNVFAITTVMFIEIIDILSLNLNSTKVAERLCAATITCMITVRTHLTIFHTEKFVKLQKQLKKFRDVKSKNSEDLEVIKQSSVHITTIAKFFSATLISVIIWMFIPLLEQNRQLPFPFQLPIDIYKTPTYEILYVFFCALLYIFSISVISNSLGYCSLMIQINSHLEIVRRNLGSIGRRREEAVAERQLLYEFCFEKKQREKLQMVKYWDMEESQLKDETTREILINVIETQKYIYDEIECFKQLYSFTLLVHIVGVLFVVAVVEITGKDEDFGILIIKRVLYISVGIFDVLVICFYGEEVKHKSFEIMDAIYMAPWHEMSVSVQKTLLVMSLRASRPDVIKAGETIRLDLATFLNIVKVGYNLVVLLRRTVY